MSIFEVSGVTAVVALLACGAVLGCAVRCAVQAGGEWRDRREMRAAALRRPAASPRPVEARPRLIRTPACPGGLGAAQILGYRDGGGRYHPPLLRGATSSAEGLAAWDARQGR